MPDFHWQTTEDDDAIWHERPTEPPRPRPKTRPLVITIITLSIIASAAALLYTLVNRQATAVTADAVNDIESSYQLYQKAIDTQDLDLFRISIAGSNPQWVAAQQELLEQNLLSDPWPLDFELGRAQISATTINPELTRATITLDQPITWGDNQTAILQRTLYAHLGRARWLIAPPESDTHGEWQTIDSDIISLTFPEQHADLARQLLGDLDSDITRTCKQLTALSCPLDLRLRVRFSNDPGTLAQLATPSTVLRSNAAFGLDLPAPDLIGIPLDQAGYDALHHAYAGPVIATAISTSLGYDCCDQGGLFEAMLARILADLGYRPWPLTETDYASILQNPIPQLFDLDSEWQANPVGRPATPQARRIYALVGFLGQQQPQLPPAEMAQTLLAAPDPKTWLTQITQATPFSRGRLHTNWLQYVNSQLPATTTLPITQDIQMMCNNGLGREASLWRYHPASATWDQEIINRPMIFMGGLPNDAGVIIQGRNNPGGTTHLFLWQNDAETATFPQAERSAINTIDADQDRVFIYSNSLSSNRAIAETFTFSDCPGDSCNLERISFPGIRSPDQRHTVGYRENISDPFNGIITIATPNGRTLASDAWIRTLRGRAPFWIDANNIGYAHQLFGQAAIVSRRITDSQIGNVKTILNHARLADALDRPEINLIRPSVIRVNSLNPGELIILADLLMRDPASAEFHQNGAALFIYDMGQDRVELRHQLAYNLSASGSVAFSADGQWLAIRSREAESNNLEIHVLSTTSSETHIITSKSPYEFPDFDWSADGQWLLRVENSYLHLFAPSTNENRLIAHDQIGCNFANWVNPID